MSVRMNMSPLVMFQLNLAHFLLLQWTPPQQYLCYILCVSLNSQTYEAMLVVVWSGFKWAARHTQVSSFLGWGLGHEADGPIAMTPHIIQTKATSGEPMEKIETFEVWSAFSCKEKGRLSRKWDFHINVFNSVANTETRMCCSHSIIYRLSHRCSCCHKDRYFQAARSDSSWEVSASFDSCTGWVNSRSAPVRSSIKARVAVNQWMVPGAFVLQVNESLNLQLEQ